ncbi:MULTISPECIES: ExbD/TolR family protein [Rhodopirellula]|jgi:biopolymer transport protein ExbD|uniref:Biopolymer transport protein ExbD/TolR n=2 Tax=Rhodopirellula europaea TaxID=1263866 RepID=M2A701_9BACT|nr:MULTISPECIES: biopolymer transporter ExbD [Rhodopirellula]EMB16846.1 Biopolymer transport protein ExbD/TolR [Rhodopirellula europaea 6C]EMI24900.1 Biopolymer transport protein ExbD/TolR [Rhodopirellula europaea SH398]MCR9208728.1 biopolymer transporter ExbD [bacterium]|tara:strand:+ start:10277 stop:10699 length:423 start_codon:yes stop_codon:yes gene_type:complete
MAVQLKRSNVAGTLSLTPLIDVVFLLLIFFLVTSEFEDEERQLDIVLPSATSAVPMTSKPREVVVDINADGTVFLRGKATPLKELELLLQKAVASNPTNQTVVIRADQNASFQPVVNVMDVCNRTGVSDYSVSTKDGPAG